jgi:hypothetical protein
VQDAVVCTHGEVIGQVLGRLVVDGLAVDQPLAWPKGSTWLLDGAGGRFRFGRYLPPLPLADALISASAPGGMPTNGLAFLRAGQRGQAARVDAAGGPDRAAAR